MSEEEQKIIFIIGNGHSGTTILYNMLAYHPDLAWFCQYSLRDSSHIPGRIRFPFGNWMKRQIRDRVHHRWEKGIHHKFIPRPGEFNSLWKYVFEDRQDRAEEEISMQVGNELKSWRKNGIIIKNPWFGKYVRKLNRAFEGKCYFIHIVRDGRAVCSSILHKHQRRLSGVNALNSAARYWIDFVTEIILFGDSVQWKNVMEIRYEDFVKDIKGELLKILNFTELEPRVFPFERIPRELNSTNIKWINRTNSRMIAHFEKATGPLLHRYGYLDEIEFNMRRR